VVEEVSTPIEHQLRSRRRLGRRLFSLDEATRAPPNAAGERMNAESDRGRAPKSVVGRRSYPQATVRAANNLLEVSGVEWLLEGQRQSRW